MRLKSKMADETEKILKVLLDKKYYFLVIISNSRSIGELRAEVENVARGLFTKFRRGEVKILEDKDGARLPDKYTVGKLLQNETMIYAYSSENEVPNGRKRKLQCSREFDDRHSKAKRKKKEPPAEELYRAHDAASNLSGPGSIGGRGNKLKSNDKGSNEGDFNTDTGRTSSTANGCDRLRENNFTCTSGSANRRNGIVDRSVDVGSVSDNHISDNDNDGDDEGDDEGIIESDAENNTREEPNEFFEGQSEGMFDKKGFIGVDQIKKKLSFGECSKVQRKETVNSKASSPGKVSSKGKVVVTKKGPCGKRRITGNGKKKKKGNKRSHISHRSKDAESESRMEANYKTDSEESSAVSESLSDYDLPIESRILKKLQGTVQHKSSDATQGKHSEQNGNKQQRVSPKCGKVKANEKKLGKLRSPPAKGKAVPKQSTAKRQENAFLRIFSDDMRELQGETECEKGTAGRGLSGTREQRGNTDREACDVQGQVLESGRGKRKAVEHIAKDAYNCLTPERRTENHCSSSAAILSASKFESLFSMPEHCRPKRKEAIEKSASKVADWLCANSVSPNVDERVPESHTDNFEVLPEPMMDTRATNVDVNHLSNKRLSTSSTGSVLPVLTQSCQVRIKKLPVSSHNGKLTVMRDPANTLNMKTFRQHEESSTHDEGDGKQNGEKELDGTNKRGGSPHSVRRTSRLHKTKKPESENQYQAVQRENEEMDCSGKKQTVESPQMICSVSTPTKRPNSETTGKGSESAGEVGTRKRKDFKSLTTRNPGGKRDAHSLGAKKRRESSEGAKKRVGEPVVITTDRHIKRDMMMKPVGKSSGNDSFHFTDVDSSCHEEDVDSLSSSSEATGSNTSVINGDSESRVHERDVASNGRNHLHTRRVVEEETEEIPQTVNETAKRGVKEKEGRVKSQIQGNRDGSVKQASSNEKDQEHSEIRQLSKKGLSPPEENYAAIASTKRKFSGTFLHQACDNTGERELSRIIQKTPTKDKVSEKDKSSPENQENVELSQEEYSSSLVDGTSESETETEDSVTDEDNSTRNQEFDTDRSPSKLRERVKSPPNQEFNVHVSVDGARCNKEEYEDSEATKASLRKSRQSRKDKLLVPPTIREAVEYSENRNDVPLNEGSGDKWVEETSETSRERSKPKKDRNPRQRGSRSIDWTNTELSINRFHLAVRQVCSDEEEEKGATKKSPKKLKSRCVSQDENERLQDFNHGNSGESVQEEQNGHTKTTMTETPQKSGKSKKCHNSGNSNVEFVEELGKGTRKRKHSYIGPETDISVIEDKSATTERGSFELFSERESDLNSVGENEEESESASEKGNMLEKGSAGSSMKCSDSKVQSGERSGLSSQMKHKAFEVQSKGKTSAESPVKHKNSKVESRETSGVESPLKHKNSKVESRETSSIESPVKHKNSKVESRETSSVESPLKHKNSKVESRKTSSVESPVKHKNSKVESRETSGVESPVKHKNSKVESRETSGVGSSVKHNNSKVGSEERSGEESPVKHKNSKVESRETSSVESSLKHKNSKVESRETSSVESPLKHKNSKVESRETSSVEAPVKHKNSKVESRETSGVESPVKHKNSKVESRETSGVGSSVKHNNSKVESKERSGEESPVKHKNSKVESRETSSVESSLRHKTSKVESGETLGVESPVKHKNSKVESRETSGVGSSVKHNNSKVESKERSGEESPLKHKNSKFESRERSSVESSVKHRNSKVESRERSGVESPVKHRNSRVESKERSGEESPLKHKNSKVESRERSRVESPVTHKNSKVESRETSGVESPVKHKNSRVESRETSSVESPVKHKNSRVESRERSGEQSPVKHKNSRVESRKTGGVESPVKHKNSKVESRETSSVESPVKHKNSRVESRERSGEQSPVKHKNSRVESRETSGVESPVKHKNSKVESRETSSVESPVKHKNSRVESRERSGEQSPVKHKNSRVESRERSGEESPVKHKNSKVESSETLGVESPVKHKNSKVESKERSGEESGVKSPVKRSNSKVESRETSGVESPVKHKNSKVEFRETSSEESPVEDKNSKVESKERSSEQSPLKHKNSKVESRETSGVESPVKHKNAKVEFRERSGVESPVKHKNSKVESKERSSVESPEKHKNSKVKSSGRSGKESSVKHKNSKVESSERSSVESPEKHKNSKVESKEASGVESPVKHKNSKVESRETSGEESPVKQRDSNVQAKQSSQKTSDDEVESVAESDDASSETDEDIEGESNGKCNSTLHLTSFKEGKEIVWMKERERNGDSEQDGLGHADFMNGEAASQPSDDFHHPGASSVVRSETPEKTAKSDGEIGRVYVDSFDSGYKSVTEKGHSVQDPVVSKKKKKVKKHKKELSPDQGVTAKVSKPNNSQPNVTKKRSKALLSLMDLSPDDSTELHESNTSPRKPVQNLMRQFRKTPKGFCHTVKNRKFSASTSSIHIRRKPRRENLNPKQMTAKERDLVTNKVTFEQLLDDDSYWDT